MAYREARNQSVKAVRATIDTLHNRMKKYGKSACEVLKMKGAYPYMRKSKVKIILDNTFLSKYNDALAMSRVLGEKYLFFNTKPHKFGKRFVKIDNLYFSQ